MKKYGLVSVPLLFVLMFVFAEAARADAIIAGAAVAGKIFGWLKNGFLIGYSLSVTVIAWQKQMQSKKLMDKLRTYEKYWDEALIKKRVPEVFMKVKQAWTKRNPSLAKDSLSAPLYRIQSSQIAEMKKRREINVLDKIKLKHIQIVNIIDHKGSSRDEVWVWLKGSMLNYMKDDRTGKITEGSTFPAKKFTEVWKFVRRNKEWVLNDIIESVGFTEISAMRPSTHTK